MKFPDTLDKSKLIHKPGVYIFLNIDRDILYVGKAIDLNKRVSSYFRDAKLGEKSFAHFKGDHQSSKTNILVSEIAYLETIVVESELEALILEANLIKKHLPPFNIRLTDDKDYLYIMATSEDFPKVLTARKHELSKASDYFGPFPSSRIVKDTLKKLRRIFPWCSQGGRKYNRACFYYHLGLCPGVCVGKIDLLEYRKNINRLRLLLSGKKDQLVRELEVEMNNLAKSTDFEKAGQIKKVIEGINYLTASNRVSLYLENPNYLEDENQKALEELQEVLKLKTLPERIEGYDISNISGQFASGSMVVLTHGNIDKSQYRKFKINPPAGGLGRPNDTAMHAEMMQRRLKHSEWPLPDLFIIDGGRGQVRATEDELNKQGISVPIFGLAKRMEWLYPSDGDVVKIPKSSLSLRLLQKLRDEAHRFAITYHRKLRSKAFLPEK